MLKKTAPFFFVLMLLISCDIRRRDKIMDDAAKKYDMLLRDTTTVQVIDSVYHFGKVTDGEKVEYNFRFKNTGNKPLVVTNATASCGCTVPQKPEKPVPPGELGFIKVVFDSKGRLGTAHKTIHVTSNVRPDFPEMLLTGEVVAKQ
jgi:hypothetical protein